MTSSMSIRLFVTLPKNTHGKECDFHLIRGGKQLRARLFFPDALSEAYQRWQTAYDDYYRRLRRGTLQLDREGDGSQLRGKKKISGAIREPKNWRSDLVTARANLLDTFHQWLLAPELAKIRDAITESAISLTQKSGAGWVDVFISCNSLEIARLPWETWPFRGIDEESRSKIRIARMAENINSSPTKSLFRPVRILAIFGDSTGLDLSKDKEALKAFKAVEDVEFDGWKKGDTRTSWQNRIFPKIADRHWDILFFAGHSNETPLTGGELGIGPNETITISELRKPLMKAKQNGLQFAIFNSCKGLKIGEALNDMGINQVVVMRYAIHDEVAPEFLKELVEHLDNHKDIHEALIETTAFFEEHPRYTSADLVPSIFRHPESEPFQIQPFGWWAQFKRRLPTKTEGLALAGLCALSLLWPIQDLLLETRVAAQARYRQLTGQLLGRVESPLKLIQVDEKSLKAAGIPDSDYWPIRYDYMAELIDKVSEAGAKVIGIDYVLDQPEENPAGLKGTQLLRDAVKAAQDRGTKLVFADGRRPDDSSPPSEGRVSDQIINPAQAVDGNINFFQWYVDLLPASVECDETWACPFAYRLVSLYPSLNPQNPDPSQLRLPGITSFSEAFFQVWLHPIIDFSVPPSQAFERISASEVFGSNEALQDLDDALVIIAAGEYEKAGIREVGLGEEGTDLFPIPAALQARREFVERKWLTGGEAHAYMVHHMLTPRLVYPIPDLWLLLPAAWLGKELYLLFFRRGWRRHRWALWGGIVGGYSLISLQAYLSAGLLFPIGLPAVALGLFFGLPVSGRSVKKLR